MFPQGSAGAARREALGPRTDWDEPFQRGGVGGGLVLEAEGKGGESQLPLAEMVIIDRGKWGGNPHQAA